jgi:UDP-N-acetylglucosamine transferase subunit ALG13
MIFVTVGTHEQPFDRLVEYMDKWAEKNEEKVIMQIGFCDYEPEFAEWSRFYGYDEMTNLVKEARIIITHGGPSSFILPIKMGKTPIVVPRQKKFDEHVNDHQLTFCRTVKERMDNIILVEDINELGHKLDYYDDFVTKMPIAECGNHHFFITNFEKSVEELVK